MKFLFFFTLLLSLSYSSISLAGNAKVVLSFPRPMNANVKAIRCNQLFSSFFREELTWVESSGKMAISEFIGFKKNLALNEAIPKIILGRWAEERGYNPEQIQKLKNTNARLDPSRTTYLGFAHEAESGPFNSSITNQAFSGARIFDGSTVPLFQGQVFSTVSPKTRALSFEIDLKEKGYELPERVIEEQTGKPSYIWEVGLLNVERNYQKGVHTLLGLLSREILDRNYNDNQYNILSRLNSLSRKNLVIYSICRKSNVKINEALGFELVYDIKGDPVRTSEGLYLMKMTGIDLMINYSDFALKPIEKNDDRLDVMTEEKANREGISDYFISLQKTAPKITTDADFLVATYRLSRLHDFLFNNKVKDIIDHPVFDYLRTVGDNMDTLVEMNRYSIFFEYYYQLAYGYFQNLPQNQKHLFDQYVQPYEIILHDFTRYKKSYDIIIHSNQSGDLISIWNKTMMDDFFKKNEDRLKNYRENDQFLIEWQ